MNFSKRYLRKKWKALSGERQAFEVYCQKGAVNHPTALIRAHQEFNRFSSLLTAKEMTALMIAESHAIMCGEGRREFDGVCDGIRSRIWNE